MNEYYKLANSDPNVAANIINEWATQGVGSTDPNTKIGPAGFGSGGFINSDQAMVYTIYFENEPDTTAAALAVPARRLHR